MITGHRVILKVSLHEHTTLKWGKLPHANKYPSKRVCMAREFVFKPSFEPARTVSAIHALDLCAFHKFDKQAARTKE